MNPLPAHELQISLWMRHGPRRALHPQPTPKTRPIPICDAQAAILDYDRYSWGVVFCPSMVIHLVTIG